jgi:hypothetical protein
MSVLTRVARRATSRIGHFTEEKCEFLIGDIKKYY